jgi:hypothetical protein
MIAGFMWTNKGFLYFVRRKNVEDSREKKTLLPSTFYLLFSAFQRKKARVPGHCEMALVRMQHIGGTRPVEKRVDSASA